MTKTKTIAAFVTGLFLIAECHGTTTELYECKITNAADPVPEGYAIGQLSPSEDGPSTAEVTYTPLNNSQPIITAISNTETSTMDLDSMIDNIRIDIKIPLRTGDGTTVFESTISTLMGSENNIKSDVSTGLINEELKVSPKPMIQGKTVTYVVVLRDKYRLAGLIKLLPYTNYSWRSRDSIFFLPLPRRTNEYLPASIDITLSPIKIYAAMTNCRGGFAKCQAIYYKTATARVSCGHAATPLYLELDTHIIDFNTVITGESTRPISRKLPWQATGAGQTNIWTMTIDSNNVSRNGDKVLLGTAEVKIVDPTGTQVRPGETHAINGTMGYYTFELDPRLANPGPASTNVNFTLTAN
ncbi:hypothetical protein [Citrobacter meridianamericanus]|uniref:hypothetical protein n=1 Tax=Citrobacter meridianamericanus TaxID=2894201 RepID=UPI00351D1863